MNCLLELICPTAFYKVNFSICYVCGLFSILKNVATDWSASVALALSAKSAKKVFDAPER